MMSRMISFHLSLAFLGILCFCAQAHNTNSSVTSGDVNDVHHGGIARNKEHIKEHLDYLDDEQIQNISEKETEFLFFNTHDYNQDKYLDGLEILSSLLHTYTEENIFGGPLDEDVLEGKSEEEINHMRQTRNSQLLGYSTGVLDNILALSDLNDDGYIDYVEYSQAQELEKLAEAEKQQKQWLQQQQQEQEHEPQQQEQHEPQQQEQHEPQQQEQHEPQQQEQQQPEQQQHEQQRQQHQEEM